MLYFVNDFYTQLKIICEKVKMQTNTLLLKLESSVAEEISETK